MELPPILNANPPETGTFGRYWVTGLNIVDRRLSATLAPYDGSHLLVEGRRRIHVADETAEPGLTALLDAALDLVAGVAGKATRPRALSVSSPSPSRATQCTGIWEDKSLHVVRDLFALAEGNAAAAQVVGGLLAFVAGKV
jgi:hypothetical protein